MGEGPERSAPRIYVADLAAYNAGTLHGEWLDLGVETTVDEVTASIHAMLQRGPLGRTAEEYAIHDHEGFHGYEVHEYESLETVVKVAAFVAEHGELGAKLVNHSYDIDEATGVLENQHAGAAESLADWVFEHVKDTGELDQIPERWHSYIDFDGYARDLELGGDIFTIEAEGEVHVFWTR